MKSSSNSWFVVFGIVLAAGVVDAQSRPALQVKPGTVTPKQSAALSTKPTLSITLPMLQGVSGLRSGYLDFGTRVTIRGLNVADQNRRRIRLVRRDGRGAAELRVVRWTRDGIEVALEASHKPQLFRDGATGEADAQIGIVSADSPEWQSNRLSVKLRTEVPRPTGSGTNPDVDGDGSASTSYGGDDCDDDDRHRYPGNHEVCDAAGLDEDCDPLTVGDRDVDGDGFVDCACQNHTAYGVKLAPYCDCDDGRAGVHHGLVDACDGLDNDCDGSVDEGAGVLMFRDQDGDGFGDPKQRVRSCDVAPGVSALGNDCDDKDAAKSPLRGCP